MYVKREQESKRARESRREQKRAEESRREQKRERERESHINIIYNAII